MTGGKAGAAAPRAGAREEKRAHSPGRGGMERSRRFRRRALHPFFLFMSCDTNAGITIQDTERPFHIILYCHKKSFHQSCEMIFYEIFFVIPQFSSTDYRNSSVLTDVPPPSSLSFPLSGPASSVHAGPGLRLPQAGGGLRRRRDRRGVVLRLPQAGGRRRAQKKRGRGQRPLPRRGGDQLLRPNGSGCPSADGPSFPSWYAGRIRSRGRLRSRWAHVPRSPCRNRTGPRSSWGCWSAGGSW